MADRSPRTANAGLPAVGGRGLPVRCPTRDGRTDSIQPRFQNTRRFLPDQPRRASSREQARDIKAMVQSLGYVIAPFRDWQTSDFTFSDAEIERLAEAEHDG